MCIQINKQEKGKQYSEDGNKIKNNYFINV